MTLSNSNKKSSQTDLDKAQTLDNPAFFPFYGKDYMASIQNLTLTQTGCFHLMMIWAYQFGDGQIPNDLEQIKGICKVHNKEGIAAIKKVLSLKWRLSECKTFYYINRIQKTLTEMKKNYEKKCKFTELKKEKALYHAIQREAAECKTIEELDDMLERYLGKFESVEEAIPGAEERRKKIYLAVNNEKKKRLKQINDEAKPIAKIAVNDAVSASSNSEKNSSCEVISTGAKQGIFNASNASGITQNLGENDKSFLAEAPPAPLPKTASRPPISGGGDSGKGKDLSGFFQKNACQSEKESEKLSFDDSPLQGNHRSKSFSLEREKKIEISEKKIDENFLESDAKKKENENGKAVTAFAPEGAFAAPAFEETLNKFEIEECEKMAKMKLDDYVLFNRVDAKKKGNERILKEKYSDFLEAEKRECRKLKAEYLKKMDLREVREEIR